MNNHLSFNISVIAPEETIFSGVATMVTIPGSEGEFSVLAGHVNFISALGEGMVLIYQNNDLIKSFEVKGGVAEVNQNGCIILVKEVGKGKIPV
jgi:F-type H+-transporting ATPase subunit epsilon